MLLKWSNLLLLAEVLTGNGVEGFYSFHRYNSKQLSCSSFGHGRRIGSVTNVNHGSDAARSPLILAASTTTRSNTRNRPRQKSVQDRTQKEAASLIRDIIEATIKAGPRAGPARTVQAYLAVTQTLLEFSPFLGGRGEFFSAPVALRKLFERMGATYIKLGQFVASSPTLCPKEYVLELQKSLDDTEPLP